MDIQLFRSFLMVSEMGNITKAAEVLNFSQPTVTTHIRTLEEQYQVRLFKRIGRKIYITEAGRQMAERVERLLDIYQELDTVMQSFSTAQQPIKVGTSTAVGSYIISPVLLDFQQIGMDVPVVVDTCADLPTTVKGLMDGRYDIAIVHGPIQDAQIKQFELSREKLVWVVQKDLLAAHQGSKKVGEYPFVNFHLGCVYRNLFEELLKERGIQSVIEYRDAEAIKRAVLDGIGTSILPFRLVEPFLADGTLVAFEDMPQLSFLMSLAFHKSMLLMPALRKLLSLFAQHADIKSGLTKQIAKK